MTTQLRDAEVLSKLNNLPEAQALVYFCDDVNVCGRPGRKEDEVEMQEQSYESRLPYLLARANRHVYGRLHAILKEHGIPVEQWRILSVLGDGEGRSMGDLAQAVLMNPPALTKAIDRMIVRALVYRRHDAIDNRRVLVHISEFGRELVADCHREVESYEQTLTAPLGPRRTEQLRRLLVSLASETEPY